MRAYLFASRWPEGFRCPVCGGGDIGVEHRRHLWQCRGCGRQHVGDGGNGGCIRRGCRDAVVLGRLLGRDARAWGLSLAAATPARHLALRDRVDAPHKLRRAMVAPEREPLTQEVEVDDGYLGGRDTRSPRPPPARRQAARRGRVEVRGNGSGRLRLQLLPDPSAHSLTSFVRSNAAAGTCAHRRLGRLHRLARRRLRPPATHPARALSRPPRVLPRAHRALSNLKTWLQGTHHGVSPKHLHVYLNEFVFRHNRRRTPLAGFNAPDSAPSTSPPHTARSPAASRNGLAEER